MSITDTLTNWKIPCQPTRFLAGGGEQSALITADHMTFSTLSDSLRLSPVLFLRSCEFFFIQDLCNPKQAINEFGNVPSVIRYDFHRVLISFGRENIVNAVRFCSFSTNKRTSVDPRHLPWTLAINESKSKLALSAGLHYSSCGSWKNNFLRDPSELGCVPYD